MFILGPVAFINNPRWKFRLPARSGCRMAPLSRGMRLTRRRGHSGSRTGLERPAIRRHCGFTRLWYKTVVLQEGKGLTAEESECASVRKGAHLRTKHQVRASPATRPRPQAGCVSTDHWNGWNARTRDKSPLLPAAHPRPVSRHRPPTAQRRRLPTTARRRVAADSPPRVPQSHVEGVEWPRLLARIRVRVQADRPEMWRKAVAQVIPFSD
ncbi:MAG: hypothetical protein JWP63_3101 [Candidatus Solibacter sp.]|nr:hypothetical protein [Candidatus Solibacter sp.]